MSEPLLMTVAEFAQLHHVSETTVRQCIASESDSYPPLKAKRVRKPGSKRSLVYITSEAARAWRDALPDA